VVAIAPLLVLLTIAGANAHTRSQSRSSWRIDGAHLTATFVAPAYEVTRLGSGVPEDQLVAAYAAHLADTVVVTAGASRCRLTRPMPLSSEDGFVRVEMSAVCEGSGEVAVEIGSFFAFASSHVHMADVRGPEQAATDYLFTDATRRHVIVLGADGVARSATMPIRSYVRMGVEHILTGADHLAFLLALLLLCDGLAAVAFMVTGFTLGHSITLATAVLGWVRPDPIPIEVLIAFTIAIAAVEPTVSGRTDARRIADGSSTVLLAMAVASLAGVGTVSAATWLSNRTV
jgi:hypothetical protein